eukprot:TRINITY_DN31656_c0_g1_i1.p1 TRINITY_DN31656_c0_g1~~TRINITY_DN31656_c0_g1_i1.p1  ORF type:complete len:364 (-),score=58.03 TRINITY_DN31656_c0_g1_i1:12-1103(-)
MASTAADQLYGLLPKIFSYVPPSYFADKVSSTCSRFSLQWYLTMFPRVVIVPDEVQSINSAINRLQSLDISAQPPEVREADRRGKILGIVLVRPGRYMESVRVTHNCHLFGMGRRGSVVVEAPGWESALVFAGLGVRHFGSGEDACITNMTFQCRNEQMRGRCVYIVMGRPRLDRCEVQGGVLACGVKTMPQLVSCTVRLSWGSGVHMTDRCRGSVQNSNIAGNKRHGILLDRGSMPRIKRTHISKNGECGIKIFTAPAPGVEGDRELTTEDIDGNVFASNSGLDIAVSPYFADADEMEVDGYDVGVALAKAIGEADHAARAPSARDNQEDDDAYFNSDAFDWPPDQHFLTQVGREARREGYS